MNREDLILAMTGWGQQGGENGIATINGVPLPAKLVEHIRTVLSDVEGEEHLTDEMILAGLICHGAICSVPSGVWEHLQHTSERPEVANLNGPDTGFITRLRGARDNNPLYS